MICSEKAFASVTILLFLLFFLFIVVTNEKQEVTDFLIIEQVETRKENIYLNFEKSVLNTLNNCEENHLTVTKEVNKKINDFGRKNDFYILNLKTKEKEKINLLTISDITRVIIYKPIKHVIVKEVYITNGLMSNKQLGFQVNTRKYRSNFLFERKYFLRKVIFC